MTATDDQPAETMPDLLAALQASIDRARGTTVTDQPAPDQPAPAKRRTGRPPLTDAATLLDAADRIGYPNLTVGAVTSAVEVKYSTFYRHYPHLHLLVAALVDRHLADVAAPDPDLPAPEYLRQLGDALFLLTEQHPGIDRALLDLPAPPDRLLAVMAAAVAVLARADVDEDDAAAAVRHVVETALAPRLPVVPGDVFDVERDVLIGVAVDGAYGVIP